jgi:hypothetical protein
MQFCPYKYRKSFHMHDVSLYDAIQCINIEGQVLQHRITCVKNLRANQHSRHIHNTYTVSNHRCAGTEYDS